MDTEESREAEAFSARSHSHMQLHSGQGAASDLEAEEHTDLPWLQIFIAVRIS